MLTASSEFMNKSKRRKQMRLTLADAVEIAVENHACHEEIEKLDAMVESGGGWKEFTEHKDFAFWAEWYIDVVEPDHDESEAGFKAALAWHELYMVYEKWGTGCDSEEEVEELTKQFKEACLKYVNGA